MVNAPPNFRRILWTALFATAVLCLAAWLRGAEYDEQYTLFLTAGAARPEWPETVFSSGLVRALQSGHAGLAAIGRDLRVTDVHPPLYFWLVSGWRGIVGDGLFAARMFSVAAALGALILTGTAARLAGLPIVSAMLLTLGCYGFTYTGVIARGFALTQLLLLGGVVCLLIRRGTWRYVLAGVLFGAATLTNYLALFVACACLAMVTAEALSPRSTQRSTVEAPTQCHPLSSDRHPRDKPADDDGRLGNAGWVKGQRSSPSVSYRSRRTVVPVMGAILGFLAFIPAGLWWFLAQRGSREGQFPPFSLVPGAIQLGKRVAAAILGGLPLYAGGVASILLAIVLGLLLLACGACLIWNWSQAGSPRARVLFLLAAIASPVGLVLLGLIFNNTPFEVRYLAFSTPFVGLLLAGTLGKRLLPVMLAVQTASIVGLMAAPQTMQPMRAAAQEASLWVEDGIVLLPRGNDGVGVVGAFAGEASPALPLLLIREGETPEHIRARIGSHRRVVLAPLEVDRASRDASDAMRRALTDPDWREVARMTNVAVYERIGGER